jgi:transketolase
MKKLSNLKSLNLVANTIRMDVVKMLYEAKSGHSAGSIGLADIFAALYFNILHHEPNKPEWEERDRLILSNGHVCPVLYSALANAGYFPKEELLTLRKLNSRLQGHPHRGTLPGLENSSGPLGQGFSFAVGTAIVAKNEKKKWRTYVILGDGEHNEGQVWEAAMFAAKEKLSNLTAIIDRNDIQIDGYTHDVMPLEPLREKYESFGWHVIDIDGHNYDEILDACTVAANIYEKPTVIIAHTIPGYGVDFMEKKVEWHGKPPTKEEGEKALMELGTRR